jgi:hypothetical protein
MARGVRASRISSPVSQVILQSPQLAVVVIAATVQDAPSLPQPWRHP